MLGDRLCPNDFCQQIDYPLIFTGSLSSNKALFHILNIRTPCSHSQFYADLSELSVGMVFGIEFEYRPEQWSMDWLCGSTNCKNVGISWRNGDISWRRNSRGAGFGNRQGAPYQPQSIAMIAMKIYAFANQPQSIKVVCDGLRWFAVVCDDLR